MTIPAGPRPMVALLGTGIMGAAMGRSMLRAGLPVRVEQDRCQGEGAGD